MRTTGVFRKPSQQVITKVPSSNNMGKSWPSRRNSLHIAPMLASRGDLGRSTSVREDMMVNNNVEYKSLNTAADSRSKSLTVALSLILTIPATETPTSDACTGILRRHNSSAKAMIFAIVIAISMGLRTSSSADVVGQELPEASWSSLHCRVEVGLGPFAVNTDVPIRITIKNAGAVPMKIDLGSPWSYFSDQLSISDSSGAIVARNVHGNIADNTGGAGFILKPAQSFVLSWYGQKWSGLSNWGYKFDKPGTYTVHVRPYVIGNNFSSRFPDNSISQATTTFVVQDTNGY
jgi:hypothetical protein